MTGALSRIRGKRLLVLNWRDIRHSQAGGAEHYMHEIARRWVAAGAAVTWMTAREPDVVRSETIDCIKIRRAGGPLGVYMRTALRLLRDGHRFDAVVDCQNGIPFFAPLFTLTRTPVVQVVHHVHQDQFADRFSPMLAAVGRVLEGPIARRVYAHHAFTAVSPSTRQELRCQLKLRAPIYVVPNGTADVSAVPRLRSVEPTIVIVSRLVPHKRIDLFLRQLPAIVRQVPHVRVHVVGDGSERTHLENLANALELHGIVTFHGYQPNYVRDQLLREAWLTVSTSVAEGWGCGVLEAASWGLPCIGLRVPGIRDSVVDGRTGWLVDSEPQFAAMVVAALEKLADRTFAYEVADHCRTWAAGFDWDRSAELLAGVVEHEIKDQARRRLGRPQRRVSRSDIATVVEFSGQAIPGLEAGLRATDQVVAEGEFTRLLLGGCDETGAEIVLRRLGITEAQVRLASRYDLLAGPAGSVLTPSTGIPVLTSAEGR